MRLIRATVGRLRDRGPEFKVTEHATNHKSNDELMDVLLRIAAKFGISIEEGADLMAIKHKLRDAVRSGLVSKRDLKNAFREAGIGGLRGSRGRDNLGRGVRKLLKTLAESLGLESVEELFEALKEGSVTGQRLVDSLMNLRAGPESRYGHLGVSTA